MLEGAWVQKDEAMKALHKVLRYKFSLGQTTASTLHDEGTKGAEIGAFFWDMIYIYKITLVIVMINNDISTIWYRYSVVITYDIYLWGYDI